jgi:hypothetical protein
VSQNGKEHTQSEQGESRNTSGQLKGSQGPTPKAWRFKHLTTLIDTFDVVGQFEQRSRLQIMIRYDPRRFLHASGYRLSGSNLSRSADRHTKPSIVDMGFDVGANR